MIIQRFSQNTVYVRHKKIGEKAVLKMLIKLITECRLDWMNDGDRKLLLDAFYGK
jgi:hypothetical protein